MSILRSSELRGVGILLAVILVLAFFLAAFTGKLEQWFGITLFGGPRAVDSIIFVSEESGTRELCIAKTDGSDRRTLTDGADVAGLPAVSPSGSRIIYVGRWGDRMQVLSIDADGGGLQQLTTATGPKDRPEFSPDGKKLSFIDRGKVYTADINGSSPRYIFPTDAEMRMASTQRLEIPAYRDYAWGLDCTSMLGISVHDDNVDVPMFLPSFSSEPIALAGGHGTPSVKVLGLARGSKTSDFVVGLLIEKETLLFVFNPSDQQASPIARLSNQALNGLAVSPDGTAVVAALTPTGEGGLSGLVRFDVGADTRVALTEGVFTHPAFSPDGESVLATIVEDGGESRDVVVVSVRTGELRRLTSDGKSYNAVWSPESTR